MAVVSGTFVEGGMHFLARDSKYSHEKPFTLRYAPGPEDGFPQTNIEKIQHRIRFHDFRDRDDLSYDQCGFVLSKLDNDAMRYEDYADTEKVEGLHASQVLSCVKEALGARSTELIDYVLRRRHPTWPIATGSTYEYQQPASRAHIGSHLGCLFFYCVSK